MAIRCDPQYTYSDDPHHGTRQPKEYPVPRSFPWLLSLLLHLLSPPVPHQGWTALPWHRPGVVLSLWLHSFYHALPISTVWVGTRPETLEAAISCSQISLCRSQHWLLEPSLMLAKSPPGLGTRPSSQHVSSGSSLRVFLPPQLRKWKLKPTERGEVQPRNPSCGVTWHLATDGWRGLWPESSLPPGAGPQDSQGTAISLSKHFWTMWAQSHDLAILGAH